MKTLRTLTATVAVFAISTAAVFACGQDCCKTASAKSKSCSTDKCSTMDKAKAKTDKKDLKKEDKAQK